MDAFYIGLHQASDAWHFERCCIHVNRLTTRAKPLGCEELLMDSQAFRTLELAGDHVLTPEEYAAAGERAAGLCERIAVVTQDYPCEDYMFQKRFEHTGIRFSVTDHQASTIERYDTIRKALDESIYLLYLLTIVAANVAIVTIGPVPVGFGLVAPAGVYFAGLAFSLRDAVQEQLGKRWTVAAVLIGACLSALLSPSLALASGLAFLVSELADFAVYTPLRERGQRLAAVAASNTVGLLIDSVLFLWLAFGSLDFLAGQLAGKLWMTGGAVGILLLWKRREVLHARS